MNEECVSHAANNVSFVAMADRAKKQQWLNCGYN